MQQAASLVDLSADVVYSTHALASGYDTVLVRADELYLDGPSKTVLLIDSGYTTTKAHLVEYAIRGNPESDHDFHGTHLASGWCPGASGSTFDLTVAYELYKDLEEDQRAQLVGKPFEKILAEAKKVKEVLSANKETVAQIEDLLPDFHLQKTITREQFETAADRQASELTDLIIQIIAEAQKIRPNLQSSDIEIQIVGGSSRVPLVQKKIREAFPNEAEKHIGTNMNGDEAVVEGVYYLWPISYYNMQNSPNAYAARVVELEEPGIYLQGSAESPARVFGLAVSIDEDFVDQERLTLEFFYYPRKYCVFSLLRIPRSPLKLMILSKQ